MIIDPTKAPHALLEDYEERRGKLRVPHLKCNCGWRRKIGCPTPGYPERRYAEHIAEILTPQLAHRAIEDRVTWSANRAERYSVLCACGEVAHGSSLAQARNRFAWHVKTERERERILLGRLMHDNLRDDFSIASYTSDCELPADDRVDALLYAYNHITTSPIAHARVDPDGVERYYFGCSYKIPAELLNTTPKKATPTMNTPAKNTHQITDEQIARLAIRVSVETGTPEATPTRAAHKVAITELRSTPSGDHKTTVLAWANAEPSENAYDVAERAVRLLEEKARLARAELHKIGCVRATSPVVLSPTLHINLSKVVGGGRQDRQWDGSGVKKEWSSYLQPDGSTITITTEHP